MIASEDPEAPRSKTRKTRKAARHTDYRQDDTPIVAWDTETAGLGGPHLDSHFYDGESLARERSLDGAFARLMGYNGKTVLAHNGAKYDFAYIASHIVEYCVETGAALRPLSRCGGIFGLEIKKPVETTYTYKEGKRKPLIIDKRIRRRHKIVIRDTMPLFNASLAQAAAAWAPHAPKSEDGPDFAAGEEYDPDNPDHVAYAAQDVIALYEAYQGFKAALWTHFGVSPAYTIGGTAVRAWKKTIPRDVIHYRLHKTKEAFVREAVRGGLVYPGKSPRRRGESFTIDRAGAYAAAMRRGVPVGSGTWTDVREDAPGFWRVRVTAPEKPLIPLLSERTPGQPLRWPRGEVFETVVCTEEMQFAEKHGYKFEVIEGLVFSRLAPVFNAFLVQCERLEYPSDGSEPSPGARAVAKALRNNLAGKLGMKPEVDDVVFRLEMPGEGEELAPLINSRGEAIPYFYKGKREVSEDYMQPHWMAYITMWQRLELFERLYQMEGKVSYADTDSLTIAVAELHQAAAVLADAPKEGYGSYTVEKHWMWFQALGPRHYLGDLVVAPEIAAGTYGRFPARSVTVAEWLAMSPPGRGLYGDDPERAAVVSFGRAASVPQRVLAEERAAHVLVASTGRPQEITYRSVHSLLYMLSHPGEAIASEARRRLGAGRRAGTRGILVR